MKKKSFIIITAGLLLAILAGAWLSSDAAAKSPELRRHPFRPRAELGQISKISQLEITITKRSGEEAIFQLDQNTQYRDCDGNTLTLDDLQQDRWVAVLSPRWGQNNQTARLVILFPSDFDPANMAGAGGVIIDIDTQADQLVLRTRLGEELVINLDAETSFKGQAADFGSLEEGMWARIFGEKLDKAQILANLVRSTYPVHIVRGEIIGIDLSSQSIIIQTRTRQSEVKVNLDSATRFRSRNGTIDGIQDLETGMKTLVVVKSSPDMDESKAVLVIASHEEDLPDQRVIGEVLYIKGNEVTIEARDGRQSVFLVDGNTRFRSRSGQLKSLDDLQVGMVVIAAGKELGSGRFQAQLIALPQLPQP